MPPTLPRGYPHPSIYVPVHLPGYTSGPDDTKLTVQCTGPATVLRRGLYLRGSFLRKEQKGSLLDILGQKEEPEGAIIGVLVPDGGL